ncbi:hypothetical protein ASE92_08825 [Pedobacter sp. Leaf41]|uniref:hypothetical protein n=1 Tax=Pedobacter sp. Leaf41 TaxID=1736218 RepID=UPI0007025317|nr:hypothetical protein [Pedobacter sp. Leaf41]KQN36216.1 hypothetical protein ASE92_08825 [Pedobacter sp. Leaf41]
MRKLSTILCVSTIILAACSSSNQQSGEKKTDSMTVNETSNKPVDAITGKLTLLSTPKIGEPINIKFTVYNNADTAAKFCKWHTPFENLMSKYVDVIMEDGTESAYKGAMAKRVMPPPADSYITLKPGDSTSVDFDLNNAFTIDKSGKYTVKYNSAGISGIVIKDSLQLNIVK